MALLHGIEAVIWAVVYFGLRIIARMDDAIIFSFGAMSTAGSGLTVPLQWRLMGAIEAFDGMLLFGISTAFLFSIMRRLWMAVEIHRTSKKT